MALDYLRIDTIDHNQLQALINEKVRESKTVEYKSKVPGNSERDRKEFLHDISSFANASGGFLFFGIEERGGAPVSISGLGEIDADREILRLEAMIQNGIEPRLPGLQSRAVPTPQGVVIAVRIPRSWVAPHMVTFQGAQRFFGRNSAGKYLLDVGEIKALALFSESIAEKARRFRVERLMAIEAGETPIPLLKDALCVLHLIPVAAYTGEIHLDVRIRSDDIRLLHPISGGFDDSRINFDGYLTVGSRDDSGRTTSYIQLFHDGRVEAVDTSILGEGYIASVYFEERIWETVRQLLVFLNRQGVQPPIVVMLSAIGVRGRWMALSGKRRSAEIDRDRLVIPEVIVESPEVDAATLLRPCFDAIWNAAGLPGSTNYDREGRWRGQ